MRLGCPVQALVGVAEGEIDLSRPRLLTRDVRGNDAVAFVSDVLQQFPSNFLEAEVKIGETNVGELLLLEE